jgi:hypothetical protein
MTIGTSEVGKFIVMILLAWFSQVFINHKNLNQ